MTLLRSALFALALVLVTPPYAILALLSFPLPRMARYRLISAWSRMVIWLAWLLCGIRWRIEGRRNLPDEPAVITAVGMAKHLGVMVAAVMIAVGVMLVFSGTISRFVEKHATLKILALSFLILIGVMLVAEGVGTEINKGFIYFAMAFALGVECLNLRASGKAAARESGKT